MVGAQGGKKKRDPINQGANETENGYKIFLTSGKGVISSLKT